MIYDHQFEPLDAERTRLTFIVEAEGLGARVLGRLFAWIYRRNLERAIPLLIAEMEAPQPEQRIFRQARDQTSHCG